jgi:flagellin
MASTINTNIASLTAQRNLSMSQASLGTSMQRLSSGLRINSAKDDAAGLAISDRMTSQIRGLNQAARNANDGISLSQVAEGALGSASNTLQRIRELAVQSANATNSSSDRAALQAEVGQLTAELDRIARSAQFNGQSILDGSFTSATFQVGANANQTIIATTANFSTSKYGNNRIGSQAAITSGGPGDLTINTPTGTNKSVAIQGATNTIAGDTLTIQGAAGPEDIIITANESAKTVAVNINAKAGSTGVNATARTSVDMDSFSAAPGSYSLSLKSNNATSIVIGFNVGAAPLNADSLASAITALNDKASQTGVTAKMNALGTGITITNDSGADIYIGNSAASQGTFNLPGVGGGSVTVTNDALATNEATITGALTLDSDKAFSISTLNGIADNGTSYFQGVGTGASQLQPASSLDVSTVEAATRSLATADAAISVISSQRAKFGALQSRFETAIANLNTTSENLSASRSRILDADFAMETSNLTRTQILQQAGTAMVAQANQLPQSVLQLLKG